MFKRAQQSLPVSPPGARRDPLAACTKLSWATGPTRILVSALVGLFFIFLHFLEQSSDSRSRPPSTIHTSQAACSLSHPSSSVPLLPLPSSHSSFHLHLVFLLVLSYPHPIHAAVARCVSSSSSSQDFPLCAKLCFFARSLTQVYVPFPRWRQELSSSSPPFLIHLRFIFRLLEDNYHRREYRLDVFSEAGTSQDSTPIPSPRIAKRFRSQTTTFT